MGNCTSDTTSQQNVCIIPDACWVVKTKTRETNSKVFLNVVHHKNIPESPDIRNPRIFIGSRKQSKDKKGDECTVIDVLVHSAVVEGITEADSPAASRLNRNIITLMNLKGQEEDDDLLNMQFSTPKIPSKYKGEEVTPVEQGLIDFAAQEKSGKRKTSGKDNAASSATSTSDIVLQEDGKEIVGGDDEGEGEATLEVLNAETHGEEENTGQKKGGFFSSWFGKKDGNADPVDSEDEMSPEELAARREATAKLALEERIEQERVCPEEKSSYMRKEGHFVTTLRKRWILLKEGNLSYFVDESMKKLKKEMNLADYYISKDPKFYRHQIYIAPIECQKGMKANGRDLLLELLDEDFSTDGFKQEWIDALQKHITYATRMRKDKEQA